MKTTTEKQQAEKVNESMKIGTLNTAQRTFLIVFLTTTEKFLCNSPQEVMKVLKEHDNYGRKAIKYIKVLNAENEMFYSETKTSLKMFLIQDAETTIFFTNHYYLN